ncbi:MAG: MarR family transcriptional regulator [Sedimentisphaerales bacterium]|nr:MarR family transcriptional regulator [Sedimentisphaerales bacterium]
MGLKEELQLQNPIALLPHEALLNIYYTASAAKKQVTDSLRPFGLTDVQFNVLMLLKHQCGESGGLSQARISQMMLVNKANITSLIDRMEKARLVKRTAADDRRFNIIMMTTKGKSLLDKVEPIYAGRIKKTMACLKIAEQKKLISDMEKIRSSLS